MAAQTGDLSLFSRGELPPYVVGKVGTGGFGFFRRGEAYPAVVSPAVVAAAPPAPAIQTWPGGGGRGRRRGYPRPTHPALDEISSSWVFTWEAGLPELSPPQRI